MKRVIALVSVLALIGCCVPALADGAPTSQFYFKGWPYRQSVSCRPTPCADETCPETAVSQSVSCQPTPCADKTCPETAVSQDVFCTARPVVTAAPSTPVKTPAPRPTAQPTARPTARPTAASSASTADYTTISVSAQEQKVWNLLNADRQKNGLPALPLDAELSRIARIKAEDMRDNGYFAHESPTWGNAASMLKAFGYAYRGVGENIAHHANVDKAEAAFMSSTGHRRNILGSQWTKVGVGVSIDKNGFVYVTQLFAR